MTRISRNQLSWHVLLFVLILMILLAEFLYMSSAPELVDEGNNWKQIKIFLNHEARVKVGLILIPGYHALIAAVMLIFHRAGIYSARFATTWISFASVILFYLLTWKLYGRPSLVKTLQYLFFPLFFVFFPLVYADVLAMLLVLLALYLILWKLYTLSGMVALLSILVRSNNIAWFAFLFVFILVENHGLNWREYPRSLKQTWFFLVGFGMFAIFLYLNGGISLTDKSSHPLSSLYSGNTIYLLFVFLFLFLPLNIANLRKMIRLLSNWRWVLPTGLLIFIVYLLTFHATHEHNQTQLDYFFRNKLLLTVTRDLALKSAFFIPVAWSLLSIAVSKLRQKNFYWLYPFTVLSLLPIWLIEPRYSFVPFSLFLLFKEESSPLVEGLTIAMYIVVGVLLLPPLRSELFFI